MPVTISQQVRPRRSQFVLGPGRAGLSSWRELKLNDELVLSFDPDLDVVQATGEHCSLVLLGFILDWREPSATNTQILDRLARSVTTFDECVESTAELGGRWAIIYQDAAETKIFHDAFGLRQICFVNSRDGESLWCASEVALLAEVSELAEDDAAVSFIDRQQAINSESWWPGDRLPYQQARLLLPNHALNIKGDHAQRYWPRQPRKCPPHAELVERIACKLEANIRAASHRFPLALGLTAGWDSRTVLAASKEIQSELVAYSSRQPSMKANDADLVVPTKLARALKLKHEVIAPADSADADFNTLLKQHTWRPHPRFAAGMQAEYEIFKLARVAMLGVGGEFSKAPYRHMVTNEFSPSGESLAGLVGMSTEKFAIEAFDEWLAGVPTEYEYNVFDLFHWEQRIGSYLAASFLEFDFVWRDIFLPYNCRSLVCDILACDDSKRARGNYELYRDILTRLSPDLLQFPVNPVPRLSVFERMRRALRRFLRT